MAFRVSDCLEIIQDDWNEYEDEFGATQFVPEDCFDPEDEDQIGAIVEHTDKWGFRWYDSGKECLTENSWNGPYDTAQDAFEGAYNLFGGDAYQASKEHGKAEDAEWIQLAKNNGFDYKFIFFGMPDFVVDRLLIRRADFWYNFEDRNGDSRYIENDKYDPDDWGHYSENGITKYTIQGVGGAPLTREVEILKNKWMWKWCEDTIKNKTESENLWVGPFNTHQEAYDAAFHYLYKFCCGTGKVQNRVGTFADWDQYADQYNLERPN